MKNWYRITSSFGFGLLLSFLGIITFVDSAFCQIKPVYIESGIKRDGFLNEEAWKSAESISDFTQMELNEGEAATEKTEVKILFDNDNIYIGVMCYDSEPDKIIHKELKWDGSLSSDDSFELVFDTYHDKRMGFYFAVNPNGAQVDATFRSGSTTNSLTSLSTEWDAIWETAAVITDQGWSCEIEIPFKSLRFPTSETQTWGVNFRRKIRRKNEEVLWKSWSRNAGLQLLSQAGTLEITKPVKAGKQIDVKPYVLAGAEKVKGKDVDDVTKAGLDLKYNITSNMTLDLTTNTDFAHIESDREVINLTRFDTFYPEKRDFFLEGSDTFDFTQGGTRLFYSRRIGITPNREEQRILGGAKLTQKAGSYRLGVLTMQTEDEKGYPAANYSVARMKKDIFEQSYVGFIATNKIDDDQHDNQVYGVDWVLKTDKFLGNRNLDVQGYLSGSVTDGSCNESAAGRLYVSYPNDLVNTFFLYHALDEQFNPELGYARVVGIKNYIWFTTLSPRPNLPFIKKLVLKPFNFNYTTDMDGRLLFRDIEIRPLGFVTKSDDEFMFCIYNDYDYIYESNLKISGVKIPQKVYNNWYYSTSFHTNSKRTVSFSTSTQWGDFYSGTKDTYSAAVTFRTSSHYSLSADAEYNKLVLGSENITTRDYGTRVSYDFSTRLSTSTFIQYNNETGKVNLNFRMRFIPKVGSDLFLVYNHIMDERDNYRTLQNTALLKLDYIYRF